MDLVNYIVRLFRNTRQDESLRPIHQSLLLALIDKWNMNYRRQPFAVSQKEMMRWAKIGNPQTYTKCLKDLDVKYITYTPGRFPKQPAKISLIYFNHNGASTLDSDTANISKQIYSDDIIDTADMSKMPPYKKKNYKKEKEADRILKNEFNFKKGNISHAAKTELKPSIAHEFQLSNELLELARQARMNELYGSNERSQQLLLQAYTDNKKGDPLLQADLANFKEIVQRLAGNYRLQTQRNNLR